MYCPRCKKENEDSAVFCRECGILLLGASAAEVEKKEEEEVSEEQPVSEKEEEKEQLAPEQITPVEKQEQEITPGPEPVETYSVAREEHREPPAAQTPPPVPPIRMEIGRSEKRRFGGRSPVHILIGGVLAVAVYLLCRAVIAWVDVDFAKAFAERYIKAGVTAHASVFLFGWSISALVGKLFIIRRRRGWKNEMYIPAGSQFNTDEGIVQAIEAVRRKSRQIRDTILGPRIQRALAHFRMSKNIKEVCDVMLEESDADVAAMEASYSLVRVFVWTIPILGFIGTVIGVGIAVAAFGNTLAEIEEVAEIKANLMEVTSGLGKAFDTTLIALVLSVIVMIVMSVVEKIEKSQLQDLDDYCQQTVVHALPAQSLLSNDGGSLTPSHLEPIRRAVTRIITEWRNQLTQVVSGSLLSAWEEADRNWQENMSEKYAIQQERLLDTWTEISEDWRKNINETHAKQQETLGKMAAEREELQREARQLLASVKEVINAEKSSIETIMKAVKEDVQKEHNMVQNYTGALNRAAGNLQDLIKLQNKLEDGLLRAAGSEGLAAVISEVRTALQKLDPALDKLVNEPIQVEVQFTAGTVSAARG